MDSLFTGLIPHSNTAYTDGLIVYRINTLTVILLTQMDSLFTGLIP